MNKSGKRNIKRSNRLKHDKTDYSDIPKTDHKFWKNAEVVFGSKKKPISIRIHEDIITWFKSFGEGYQTKINEVLKSYMMSIKKRKS